MIRDGLRQTAILIEEHKVQPDIAILQKIFQRGVIEPALRSHDRHQPHFGRQRASVSINAAVLERPLVHLVTKVDRAKGVKQQGQPHEHIRRVRIQTGFMQHLRQDGSIEAADFDGRKNWRQVQVDEFDIRRPTVCGHRCVNPLQRQTTRASLARPKRIDKLMI